MDSKFSKGKFCPPFTLILGYVIGILILIFGITVPERPDFPQEEEKVIEYWKEIDAFKQQMKRSEGKKPYTFYDGPPFATGLPHYGHIAAGTIKVSQCPSGRVTSFFLTIGRDDEVRHPDWAPLRAKIRVGLPRSAH